MAGLIRRGFPAPVARFLIAFREAVVLPVAAFLSAFFGNFVVQRVLLFMLTIWVAATVIFVLPRLTGQDPVKEKLLLEAQRGGSVQAGMNEMAKEYSARLGLDLPIEQQYINYMYDLLRLDFGYSIA